MQNNYFCDPNVLTHSNVSKQFFCTKQKNFFCSWKANKISLDERTHVNLDSPLPFILYHTHSSLGQKKEEKAASS